MVWRSWHTEALVPQAFPAGNETGSEADTTDVEKLELFTCAKKYRRIISSDDIIVTHERGKGQESFKWKKRSSEPSGQAPAECSPIFVEPMKWMQTVREGFVGEKLLCIWCNANLGSFNWAGMQCNCGAWINPTFQLHKQKQLR